jgi:hypothetical protein
MLSDRLTDMSTSEITDQLRDLLFHMDVPAYRIERMDLGWLHRNLGINNGNHPDFDEAEHLVDTLLRIEAHDFDVRNIRLEKAHREATGIFVSQVRG